MIKKMFSIILSIGLVLSLCLPAMAQEAAKSEKINIQLLATSDIHGYYMPWDYSLDQKYSKGSMAQIATVIKQLREENPNTIVMDNGDLIQGNSSEIYIGQDSQPGIAMLNYIGYDVWEMGNHEYNFGLDNIEKFTQEFKGDVIAANVYKENGERLHKPYSIIEKAGVKIAIVGLVTPLITEFEAGTAHLKGITSTNPKEELKKLEAELEGKVDAIVLLAHMGLKNENSLPDTGLIDVLNGDDKVVACFAGHMHLLENENMAEIPVVEPGKYAQAISKINLEFENVDGKMKLVNKVADNIGIIGETPVDPEAEKLLEPYHKQAVDFSNQKVGELLESNMVPDTMAKGVPQVQIQESYLADFFHNVMLAYSKADVVAMQIDNDKAQIKVGDIKRKDINYCYQYVMGEVSNFEFTGEDLKTYMEWSAGYYNTSKENDATISFNPERRASKYSTNDMFGGITYNIDLTKEAGNRISDLKRADGSEIKPEDKLIVGMNEYRLKFLVSEKGPLAGKNFTNLWRSNSNEAYGEEGGTIRNLSIRYLTEVAEGKYTPKAHKGWNVIAAPVNPLMQEACFMLLNKDLIKVPATEDGKYSNVASINVMDKLPKEELDIFVEKYPELKDSLKEDMTKGEAYLLVKEKLNK